MGMRRWGTDLINHHVFEMTEKGGLANTYRRPQKEMPEDTKKATEVHYWVWTRGKARVGFP